MFAFNAGTFFKGEFHNEDTESERDSSMSDCVTAQVKGGCVQTIGEHLLCLITFDHVTKQHGRRRRRRRRRRQRRQRRNKNQSHSQIPFMSKSSEHLIGSDYISLNIEDMYVTKLNTVEADKLVHQDDWYCIRSKVHREVRSNAVILLVAGGHGDKGAQSISPLKNNILGIFQCSAIIRDGKEIKRFSKRYKLKENIKNKKIMIIESKAWFKTPIFYPNYLNNGFVQPFQKAKFPGKIIQKIIKESNKVCQPLIQTKCTGLRA